VEATASPGPGKNTKRKDVEFRVEGPLVLETATAFQKVGKFVFGNAQKNQRGNKEKIL